MRSRRSPGHFAAMMAIEQTSEGDVVSGAVSGISDDVPRLDRFVEAAQVVAGARTMSEFEKSHDAPDLLAGMDTSSDRSRRSLRQMILSLSAPLQNNNRQIMADASPALPSTSATRF